jgi:hypothetical protein
VSKERLMRGVFGVVGLLVALGIVAVVAKKQLQATGQAITSAAPAASAGNVAEQSRQIQQQIKTEIGRALEAGARKDEAGQ